MYIHTCIRIHMFLSRSVCLCMLTHMWIYTCCWQYRDMILAKPAAFRPLYSKIAGLRSELLLPHWLKIDRRFSIQSVSVNEAPLHSWNDNACCGLCRYCHWQHRPRLLHSGGTTPWQTTLQENQVHWQWWRCHVLFLGWTWWANSPWLVVHPPHW